MDQRRASPHHSVEPPETVVSPRVERSQRTSLLVFRRRTHKPVRAGAGQRGDGALEAELCQRLGLALARAKAGAPEQALSLLTG